MTTDHDNRSPQMKSAAQQYATLKPICHRMWSVTPYAKCDLRCLYCCTLVQGDSKPTIEPVEAVFREIMQLPPEDTVIFGAFSDAYPNAEADHGYTRALLEKLAIVDRPVTIVTKGTTIVRDLDLLRKLKDNVLVQISIATMNDDIALRMEPGAAPISSRLKVLNELHSAGVTMEVNALPWIPDVSDLESLLNAIPENLKVNVAPLATPTGATHTRLLGRTFQRDEIISSYLAERERLSHHSQLSWVRPANTGHHHPFNRFGKVRENIPSVQM